MILNVIRNINDNMFIHLQMQTKRKYEKTFIFPLRIEKTG